LRCDIVLAFPKREPTLRLLPPLRAFQIEQALLRSRRTILIAAISLEKMRRYA